MAASRAVLLTFCKIRFFPCHSRNRVSNLSTSCRVFNSSSYDPGYTRDPGAVFFNENVQHLLQKMTGCDHEKVFRNRKVGGTLEAPNYQLLTDEELERVMAETAEKAKLKLKMPPLMNERSNITKIIAHNPELQGFDKAKYIFTDISPGIGDKKRTVVARDPDGSLREASWEERERVCQIYFPRPGKDVRVPKMFRDENFQACLSRDDYEFILDRACAQFEPDDPIYIRATRKTYDRIDQKQQYDVLRSTRHFGPMTLHLVLSKRLDDLLLYFITRQEVDAASDLVRLFHLIEKESVPSNMDEHQLIADYVKNHALKKSALELAWDALLEIEKQRNELVGRTQKASN